MTTSPLRRRLLSVVTVCLALAVSGNAVASESEPTPLENLKAVAERLRESLEPAARKQVVADVIAVEEGPLPVARATVDAAGGRVVITPSFVELLHRLARAKAIGGVRKRYYEDYLAQLAGYTPGQPLPALPDDDNPRYARLDVINAQLSVFNQMAGGVLALELSHVHLGHAEKHRAQARDAAGQPVPWNRLVTHNEWEQTVRVGVRNAVHAGSQVEGLGTLYRALETLSPRPAWVDSYFPATVKVSRLIKDAERVQWKMMQE